ncbi:MAG: dolichyl-phosphate-mannose--protein mannosyltransferase [Nocardioidaceae bacterium]
MTSPPTHALRGTPDDGSREGPAPEPRRTMGLSWTADSRAVPSARRRMVPLVRHESRLAGWLVTAGITLLALFLRLWHVGSPHTFEFDETYYAKDAWSLWHHGYVTDYVDQANQKILAGQLHGLFERTPSMVVHPEVGKWIIGFGEHLFGMTPFGWRVMPALFGSLLIAVLIRLVRRLTGSTLLGAVAGLLLCFDGLELVMSRLALLDIFLAFFLLSAVACLVADRDWGRLRMARLVPAGYRTTAQDWGPVRGLLWRPWRLAAGVCFGLALGTKWDALIPLAGFGILVWLWDAGARRSLGVRHPRLRALVADGAFAFVYLVLVALFVYLATWTGWLLHAHAYETYLSNTQYGPYWGDYVKHRAHGFVPGLFQSLRSLWNYHVDVYNFHTKFLNDATHTYQSKPQGWLILNRPVGVDAQLGIKPGTQGCTAPADSTCLRQVLLLGTPALWWGGLLALLYAVYGWAGKRDWRFGLVLVGVLTTWLPWIRYDQRPIFSYYAVAIVPFTVIALTLCIGTMMGGPHASPRRRTWGTAIAGAFLLLVLVNFAWFWPIWTDQLISTPHWLQRVWFREWI